MFLQAYDLVFLFLPKKIFLGHGQWGPWFCASWAKKW